MQESAYEDFRARYIAKVRAEERSAEEALRRHDERIREKEKARRNLIDAVERGRFSDALVARLEEVDAELKALRSERDAMAPAPIELPANLPALYRGYVADLVGTLSSEEVAGPAADELHRLVDEVVVTWDPAREAHGLELRGDLAEMLNATKPAGEAGFGANGRFLKLVAGARSQRCRTAVRLRTLP